MKTLYIKNYYILHNEVEFEFLFYVSFNNLYE